MTPQRGLFRRYLKMLTALICGTLLVLSVAYLALAVQQQRERADVLLVAESRLATVQIQAFLSSIVASMSWVLDYDQPGTALNLDALRDESQRLLRKNPSLLQLRYLGANACVLLEISRIDVDRKARCGESPLPAGQRTLFARAREQQVAYGPVQFRDGSAPYVELAIAARGVGGGVLVAQIDLRQIHATITGIHVGSTGYAFIVDGDWQLIAHPDSMLVLRHLDLTKSPAVAAALLTGPLQATVLTPDIDARYVLSAAVRVPGPNWRVFVQLPATEAFQPIFTVLWLTLLAALLAMIGAVAASYVLAQRMSNPILALRAGAEKMGAGDLQTRIAVTTGDEVELLAHEFNRMAGALGESYAQLEEKVRQRTLALEQSSEQVQAQAQELSALNAELSVRLGELAERKDEAERASAAKTRFLATASHDLLQPMHAVGLMVGILRQKIRYPDVSRLVMKIEVAVQGMESLFSSLLDISKLDSQAVTMDMQAVEIANLFGFIGLHYQPLALEKGIALRIARCSYVVHTDPALLERIVANLVSNAIRYTEHGKVLLGCRRRGDMLHVLVYDTGIGIPEQFQTSIFDEFYQINQGGIPHGKGLGLGLSIVRRCATLLGLTPLMWSMPGRGSVFGIAIPLARQTARKDLHGISGGDHEVLRGAFIVIVDDDQDACDAMAHLFQAAGSHVVSAHGSEMARKRLVDHLRTPDLIVTDLRLGQDDSGLQLIAALRADNAHPIPALILTGESHPPAADTLPPHCRLARKPVGHARLFTLCVDLLNLSARA